MQESLLELGMKTRREVLGNEYVDAALQSADEFSMPLQKLVGEYCWGDVWNRPGIDRRTRSLLNIAMLTALNRPHELKVHIRGAINNSATKDEIRETLMQTAIYCGIPAAVDSFRSAREVFSQLNI